MSSDIYFFPIIFYKCQSMPQDVITLMDSGFLNNPLSLLWSLQITIIIRYNITYINAFNIFKGCRNNDNLEVRLCACERNDMLIKYIFTNTESIEQQLTIWQEQERIFKNVNKLK